MKKMINSLLIMGVSAAFLVAGCGGSGETSKTDQASVEVDSSSVNVGPISVQKTGSNSSVSLPGITVSNTDGEKSVNMPGINVSKRGQNKSISMPGLNGSVDESQVSLEDINISENRVTVGDIEVLSEGDDSKVIVPGGIEVNNTGGKSTIKLPGGMTITTD